jgi:hypothetical protein
MRALDAFPYEWHTFPASVVGNTAQFRSHRQVSIGTALALLNGELFIASLRRCHPSAALLQTSRSILRGLAQAVSKKENSPQIRVYRHIYADFERRSHQRGGNLFIGQAVSGVEMA